MLATSVSGTPSIPEIAGIDNFKGEVLHSSRFRAGRQWAGRPVIVFGTGTSAHDICQELQAAGADVTMVQRSPTMVVNVEPAQLYDKTYLGDGPPIASRDILNSGVPLPVMKAAHKLVTDEVKRLDAPLLTRLEAAGFRLEYGEDGTGWPLKFRTRGGGYYFNVGASELIADGKIKLVQAADIEGYVADGLKLRDGTTRKAELFVLATGYKGPDHLLTQLFGADVADRVGRVWGFDEARPSFATCGRARRSRACGSPAAHFRRRESTAATSRCRSMRSRRGGWGRRCGGRRALSYRRHCLRQTQSVCAREHLRRSNPVLLRGEMDCFASLAMTLKYRSTTTTVIPRACGGSSTLRLIGSIIDVSGILGHPPEPVIGRPFGRPVGG